MNRAGPTDAGRRPMRVLAIGEAMVELSEAEAPGLMRMGFAGDTLNTAWYLARLRRDWRVDYLTCVGTDPISDRLTAFLEAAGIGTRHVTRHPVRTVGLYMIATEAGERHFTYWRDRSAARTLADDPARLDAALAGTDIAYLSGITLAVVGAEGRATLADALGRARAAGTRVAFDPNLRPALWPDADTMRAAVMEAAAYTDIALPSHEDEAAWFGDVDPGATVDRYTAAGVATVVVKDGPREVVWRQDGSTGAKQIRPARNVQDTTAAGDSFNGGLLAHLDEGIEAAIAAGADLATGVVAGRGALVEDALTSSRSTSSNAC